MSQTNLKYFAVFENQQQAVEIPFSDLDDNDLKALAIYRVDFDVNDMPLEDVLIYLPAYHINSKSVIRKSGISLYSGTMSS
jgi:hypothetical protein